MSGFYVKRIVAKSPTKADAVVSFGPKLNIIEGHSNTGKTCVAKCIDFAFGGSTKTPFKESSGYDRVVMTISTYDGKELTIDRTVGKNTATVTSEIEGIESDTYDIEFKKKQKHPVLNTIWLKLMGIDGDTEPMVVKNSVFEKKRLTWKTLLRLFYLDEDRVGTSESIIIPQHSYYENTYVLSSLLFLLTGRDFSETDAKTKKEIRQARKKAVTEYVNSKIQDATKRREELGKELEVFGDVDVNAKIAEMVASLETAERSIAAALSESKTLLSAIVETEEREVECDVLISRFKKLRDQYSADIKRLSFIVDGEEEMHHVPAPATCPFCDGKITPRGRESYVASAKAELSRIAAQLDGLISAEKDVFEEKAEITDKLTDLRRKQTDIDALIEEELRPKAAALSESIVVFKAYNRINDEMSLIASYAQTFAVDLGTYDISEDDDKLEYHPKEYFDDGFQTMMTEFAEEILKECKYENLTSARFDMSIFDIEVNGESKDSSHGKGYRAYLNAIVMLMLRKYFAAYAKYSPRMFIIDTPLHGFDEGLDETAPESMRTALFQYFINHQDEGQLIVIENLDHIPHLQYEEAGATVTKFVKGREEGRYGFLNDVI
jgi:hypothetical protein